ncbi:zinc-binding dehydrogenase [Streptomyces tsukubensis]
MPRDARSSPSPSAETAEGATAMKAIVQDAYGSEDLLTLKDLTEKGQITPVIDRTYPLAEAPAAIHHLRHGHPQGKVVVTI